MDLYLSENQQIIERHLQQARELQSRLAISEPDTLLEPLTNLQQAHTEFLQTINFHVIDKYTSTVGKCMITGASEQSKACSY